MTVQPEEEKAQGNPTNVYIKPEGRVQRRQSQASLSGPWDGTRVNGPKLKHRRFPWTSGNTFFTSKCYWALAQVAQSSCWVSIHGDTQKPSGHGPEQLAWPAVLTQTTSRGSFKPNHWVTPWSAMWNLLWIFQVDNQFTQWSKLPFLKEFDQDDCNWSKVISNTLNCVTFE